MRLRGLLHITVRQPQSSLTAIDLAGRAMTIEIAKTRLNKINTMKSEMQAHARTHIHSVELNINGSSRTADSIRAHTYVYSLFTQGSQGNRNRHGAERNNNAAAIQSSLK